MTISSLNKSRPSRIRTKQEAIDYFKNHQRSRGKDLQVNRAQTLSWNSDGSRIVIGSNDRSITVLQVDNSCRLSHDFTATSHEGSVDQVAFQQSSTNIFASASEDKSVCIWDVRQSKKHTRLPTKVPNMYVTWSPCGTYIFYLGRDDILHAVDGRTLTSIKMHDVKREAGEFVCHPNGKYLFIATSSGKIEVLSMPDLEPRHTIQAHSAQSFLNCIAITKDGTKLAVGGNDALITLWNLESMSPESSIPRMDYSLRSLSFTSDGFLLAAGSEDHHVDISWIDDSERVFEMPLEAETYSLAWHPRHLVLAYTCSSPDSRGRSDDIRLFGLSG